MKQIRVFSRQVFNTYCEEKNWDVVDNFNIYDTDMCVIEVLDTMSGINQKPFFSYNSPRVLIQSFDDVDGSIGDAQPISMEQADEIYKFIVSNKDCTKFIVHCAAGISRSGAIGMFIYDYLKSIGEDKVRFPEYSFVRPNIRVSSMLNRFFYSDEKIHN